MTKTSIKPGTMVYPAPAVMVSCGSKPDEYNIITIAWTGNICSAPPMCYISLRPQRYSYDIIKRNMEFVINLTTEDLAEKTDWCGIKSGRDYNKFSETGLHPEKATVVNAPLILESPVNIECVVKEIKELGVHHMFISEVVAINADDNCFVKGKDQVKNPLENLTCYIHNNYYQTGEKIGKFGFAAKKTPNK